MTNTYGFGGDDLARVKTVIETALGIHLEARESFYRGGDYYLAKLPGGDQVALQKNLDLVGGSLRHEEYPEVGLLLLVSSSNRADEFRERLMQVEGIRHLTRTVLTPEGKLSVERITAGSPTTEL
ncbi:MAG TPA: hypothetical protein VKE74_09080 [Gemmataceae bacterium]|nr:hypothetical protein [Gemmataceae bacterium]